MSHVGLPVCLNERNKSLSLCADLKNIVQTWALEILHSYSGPDRSTKDWHQAVYALLLNIVSQLERSVTEDKHKPNSIWQAIYENVFQMTKFGFVIVRMHTWLPGIKNLVSSFLAARHADRDEYFSFQGNYKLNFCTFCSFLHR